MAKNPNLRSKSVATVRRKLDESLALRAVPSVLVPGLEAQRALSHKLTVEIEALQLSIEKSELDFLSQTEAILAKCQRPGLSSSALEAADMAITTTKGLIEQTDSILQESKSTYEKADHKYEASKQRSRFTASEGEGELRAEVRELYRPFLGASKRGAIFYSSGTTSPFVTIPDESLSLLEQVNIFEEQLNTLVTDYETRFRDLIVEHNTASHMVRFVQGTPVEKTINLLKLAGDAISKQQSVSAAQDRVKNIADKLKKAGYTQEKADLHKAAQANLTTLKFLKSKLLALHQTNYVSPKILTELKEKAVIYSTALKEVEVSCSKIFADLNREIATHITSDRGEIGTKFTLSEFVAASPVRDRDDDSTSITSDVASRSINLSPVASTYEEESDVESSVSATSPSPGTPVEDSAPVLRQDLEKSTRTRFIDKTLLTAITAAVRDHCERNHNINPKIFARGKPEIDFATFLKQYLPYPEYGPSYRQRFGDAVEKKYEEMRVGALINLLKMDDIVTDINKHITTSSELESDLTSPKKRRGRSVSPVARHRSKGSSIVI